MSCCDRCGSPIDCARVNITEGGRQTVSATLCGVCRRWVLDTALFRRFVPTLRSTPARARDTLAGSSDE